MTRHETLLAWVNESGAGHFVIEGRWCIEALLGNPRFEVEGIVRAAGSHGDFVAGEVPVHEVPKSELSAAAGYTFHRGLIAVAKRPVDDVVPDGRLLVACPELADSANLGAIIRSAAALGASGILLPKSRGADVYSRKAIRASSGAVFRLPVHQSDDLFQRISDLKTHQAYHVLGTALTGGSVAPEKIGCLEQAVVVFGPEEEGLGQEWQDLCDQIVEIPMRNAVDSLNVSASAAIVLYELSKAIPFSGG